MKQLSFLLLLVCSLVASAQSPQGISYQAVATDVQGAPLDNQVIVVRFSILEAAPTGAAVYIETHNTSTDPYGMFNLNLGMGIQEGGAASSLGEVNWGLAAHFLKVELDIEGDGGFVSMGTQQMMSVPYALYAEQAGNAGDDQDQDPTNELQALSLSGDTLSLSNGGAVVLSPSQSDFGSQEIFMECVDMGISPVCGGIGINPEISLGPQYYGYRYVLDADWNADEDFLFDSPHWRKFQIHGIDSTNLEQILFRFDYGYSSENWQTQIWSQTPEISADGNIFIYFYNAGGSESYYDCIAEGIELVIPLDNAINIGPTHYRKRWELGYANGSNAVFTGVLIDF